MKVIERQTKKQPLTFGDLEDGALFRIIAQPGGYFGSGAYSGIWIRAGCGALQLERRDYFNPPKDLRVEPTSGTFTEDEQ